MLKSKWAVSLTVLVVAFWLHNTRVLLALVGAGLNGVLTKLLKRALAAPRPGTASSDDHGMPSSHASVCLYLGCAAWHLLADRLVAGLLWLGALHVADSRVRCGEHTVSQVLVGALLGAAVEIVWWHAVVAHVEDAAVEPWLMLVVCAFCGFVVAFKEISRWWRRNRATVIAAEPEMEVEEEQEKLLGHKTD